MDRALTRMVSGWIFSFLISCTTVLLIHSSQPGVRGDALSPPLLVTGPPPRQSPEPQGASPPH